MFNSKFDGVAKSGSAQGLVRYYEKLGYDAKKEKDNIKMHLYFQHAEHYKKVDNGQEK